VVPDCIQHADARPHWERIGVERRVGVCVPLSSIRTGRSFGIGDAADLVALVDWCRSVGARVVQMLPLNDMGADCVPYAAISAFAIDPVYVALDRIPGVEADAEYLACVREAAAALEAAPRVDFAAVRAAKWPLLVSAFRRTDGPALRSALAAFRAGNGWLADWLPYRAIKEAEGWASWETWGPRYADPAAVSAFSAANREKLDLLLFSQWVLDRQLRDARAHAAANGVLLLGDVPILVSRDSADVWRRPDIFRLDTMAGAPPDMYSAVGQTWGFPTYDWSALAAEDHGWWRARLRQAERWFDLYRIDHVVGFFRIWTLAADAKDGLEGRFVPGDEAVWGDHGRGILRMMLESSTMLPVGEDLGTIPDVCRDTLRAMGICGMKVQRWERRWHGDRGYIDPAEFHPLSLATLATHDSETLAGWWRAYPEDAALLYRTLGHDGPAPADAPPDVQREIVRWIGRAGSLFVVHLLQDLLQPLGLLPGDPADHRINLPGTVNDTNWRWRCPVTVERLSEPDVVGAVRDMLAPTR
jgi:4-alpha-glucanotransferase